MGRCTCVGKDIDQTNKNSLNVSELVNPDPEKPIEHKNYKKEQTDQTNALETEKNRTRMRYTHSESHARTASQ